VALSNSYAIRRRLTKLLAAIRRPDGPAFVVLNDDMPERTAAKESKAMEELLYEWMEKLWPKKVKFFSPPHMILTLTYFVFIQMCWEY
jgi:hypothetical protein